MNHTEAYQQQFAALPLPLWKRSPLPEGIFDKAVAKANLSIEGEDAKVSVLPLKELYSEKSYEDYREYYQKKGSHQKSLGDKFDSYISGFTPDALLIVSKSRSFEAPVIKLSYEFNEAHKNYLLEQLIIAEAGAKLEVIIDLSSAEDTQLNYFGKTKIVARNGARVKVVKLQRLDAATNVFDQNLSIVDEGGFVEIVDIQIGAQYKAIAHESELEGRHSRSEMKAAYYGEHAEKLDLSYTMTHGARQTESVILAKGALADQSQKVFRGNLFFKTGSSESVGKEQEFLTLLSPNVKSDSFPALMCSEDDVVGEHAASIGQIDPEKLFYLMSRGLSEVEARRLMVKASFEEIIRALGDETLESLILSEVDRRIV